MDVRPADMDSEGIGCNHTAAALGTVELEILQGGVFPAVERKEEARRRECGGCTQGAAAQAEAPTARGQLESSGYLVLSAAEVHSGTTVVGRVADEGAGEGYVVRSVQGCLHSSRAVLDAGRIAAVGCGAE